MERSVKEQNGASVAQKHYQGHLLVLFPLSAWSACGAEVEVSLPLPVSVP